MHGLDPGSSTATEMFHGKKNVMWWMGSSSGGVAGLQGKLLQHLPVAYVLLPPCQSLAEGHKTFGSSPSSALDQVSFSLFPSGHPGPPPFMIQIPTLSGHIHLGREGHPRGSHSSRLGNAFPAGSAPSAPLHSLKTQNTKGPEDFPGQAHDPGPVLGSLAKG